MIKRSNFFEFQEKYWFKRVRPTNFAKGDANTKYSHTCDSTRKNIISISSSFLKDGNVITNPDQIFYHIPNEFQQNFISNTN